MSITGRSGQLSRDQLDSKSVAPDFEKWVRVEMKIKTVCVAMAARPTVCEALILT